MRYIRSPKLRNDLLLYIDAQSTYISWRMRQNSIIQQLNPSHKVDIFLHWYYNKYITLQCSILEEQVPKVFSKPRYLAILV